MSPNKPDSYHSFGYGEHDSLSTLPLLFLSCIVVLWKPSHGPAHICTRRLQRSQVISGKCPPFSWPFPEWAAHPALENRRVWPRVCDRTCARQGGEERGRKLQATWHLMLKLVSTPLDFRCWQWSQMDLHQQRTWPSLFSELPLLAACQNESWAFNGARSQDCRFMDLFSKLLLEGFSGIYLLQASGQGSQEQLCSAGFGVTQACCLTWVPLFCVVHLLLVCCQDAPGYQPPLLIKGFCSIIFHAVPLQHFSRSNTWGCSKQQRDNAGTRKTFNVVTSDYLSWSCFLLKWLLSPQIPICLSLASLNSSSIPTLIKVLTAVAFLVSTWSHTTITVSAK